jgi:hypothetical protein
MNSEFELNLDSKGRPCIKFKHHDKHNSMEQKTLKVFLDAVKGNGCKLVYVSGFATKGTSVSYDNYEIQIGNVAKENKTDEPKESPIVNINSGATNYAISVLEIHNALLEGKRRVFLYDKANGLPENCDPIDYDEKAHNEIKLAISILKQ